MLFELSLSKAICVFSKGMLEECGVVQAVPYKLQILKVNVQ